jgi:hypothetical protein
MPMLFWLPMILASALLEMNGFAPRRAESDAPPAA